jgi:hypothetical protein
VEPYFQRAKPDQVVVIKAREPAGIMTATGAGDKWHLETKYRWVNQYNFYLQDAEWRPHVRPGVPLLSVLNPHLTESAPLAGPPDEASRHPLRSKAEMPSAGVAIRKRCRR